MIYDSVLTGGKVALPNSLEMLDVGISEGKIAALGESGSLRGEEVVDASSRLVLPGGLDIHVHLREPGFTHKEDIAHGTAAAACGGFTCLCDMPNTNPPITTSAALEAKKARVEESARVDVGLWAGGTHVGEFREMQAAGAVGLKIYMVGGHTYGDEIHMPDDATLLKVLGEVARLDWLAAVHVGNDEISALKKAALLDAGRTDPRAFMEFINDFSALEGLHRVLVLAEQVGARMHIAHLSVFGVDCVDAINYFRSRGVRVSTEIDPPCLNYDDLDRLGTYALPFVLSDEEQSEFWAYVESGDIEIIATDHAPHTKDEKEPGEEDVWAAPNGFPAIETSMAIAFNAVLEGKLSLGQMVSAMAAEPARIAGLSNKGQIAIGKDADLVLLDPKGSWTVDQEQLHSKAGWSPFHGKKFRGRITKTILRGEVIAENGELVGESPRGRFVAATIPGESNGK